MTAATPVPVGHAAQGAVRVEAPPSSLLDALDRVLEKGASVDGSVVISIADVDLVAVHLKLLLAAVETLEQGEVRSGAPRGPSASWRGREARWEGGDARPAVPAPEPAGGVRSEEPALAPTPASPARGIALAPESAEKGVARLVLTLVDFIRRLLERQAIRRMEGGLVADEAIERMGETLARLEAKLEEVKRAFGLEGDDLELDLGPLGRLIGPERRA